jgi:hypothetical protein
MITENEKLNALRAVIAAECEARIAKDHELAAADVATWLVRHKRAAVIDGLSDLVCQWMEQRNDNHRVERILHTKPELKQWESMMRGVSETLGVPLWFLLQLEDKQAHQSLRVTEYIFRLRAAEAGATAEALKAEMECLLPVMEGHSDMTMGQARS